jgi:hypothetical protein
MSSSSGDGDGLLTGPRGAAATGVVRPPIVARGRTGTEAAGG